MRGFPDGVRMTMLACVTTSQLRSSMGRDERSRRTHTTRLFVATCGGMQMTQCFSARIFALVCRMPAGLLSTLSCGSSEGVHICVSNFSDFVPPTAGRERSPSFGVSFSSNSLVRCRLVVATSSRTEAGAMKHKTRLRRCGSGFASIAQHGCPLPYVGRTCRRPASSDPGSCESRNKGIQACANGVLFFSCLFVHAA